MKPKKSTYVLAMLQKGQQVMATTDCKERLQLKKIQIAKEKTKRHQRKTLTVSNPFELRTQKRVRLDIEEKH